VFILPGSNQAIKINGPVQRARNGMPSTPPTGASGRTCAKVKPRDVGRTVPKCGWLPQNQGLSLGPSDRLGPGNSPTTRQPRPSLWDVSYNQTLVEVGRSLVEVGRSLVEVGHNLVELGRDMFARVHWISHILPQTSPDYSYRSLLVICVVQIICMLSLSAGLNTFLCKHLLL
jgi:hypothetical protein